MNHQRKSDMDPMRVPESPETSERLDELERRLKATRPQPPRLDMAALQQLADEVVERPTDRKSRRVATSRKRRIVGRMLVVAGSWGCGAGVGALVMFVWLSRTSPETESNNDVVQIEQEAPSLIAHDPMVVETAASGDRSAPRLTRVFDPLEFTYSPYLTDASTLQVRPNLRRRAERPREFLNDDERAPAERWTRVKSYQEPESPVSRRELMQEFLGESPGAVL
ncbi:MAG TPA: hypothetical protein VMM76_20855 [Pirellulaceae bacterium]|nr:hypothetical protein [Pirellulaceae bacterium]